MDAALLICLMLCHFGYYEASHLDYSFKMNAVIEQRLAELRKFFLPMPEDQFEDLLALTARRYIPVQAESVACLNHSNYLLDTFLQGDTWALRMVDAGSKLVSGVLDGHLQDLGNYRQCVSVEEPNRMFRGQHCVVETTGFLPPDIAKEIKRVRGLYFDMDVMFSICVPSSCSVQDVVAHLDRQLAGINASATDSTSDPPQAHITCSSALPPPLRLRDYLTLSMFATIAVVVAASSLHESYYGSKPVLSAFSLASNFQGLMDTRTPPAEISCLNGLRVIFIITVIMYHRMGSHLLMPTTRNATLLQAVETITIKLFEIIPKSVDGFFLLSGTVLSYSFFRNREKSLTFNPFHLYISRYFRLTALQAVAMLVSATVFLHVSEGPLWSRQVRYVEQPCLDYWWSGLLHISNYYNPDEQCVPQSWYVDCDFQLHLLAPLFLVPLYKRPQLGMGLLTATFLVSTVATTIFAYNKQLYTGYFYSQFKTSRMTDYQEPMHNKGFHFRIPVFLMGIVLGHLIFIVKQNKKNIKLTKPAMTVGWITCAGMMAGFFTLTMILVDPDHQFSPWLDPLYYGLSRPVFGACLSWVIYACTNGYGGLVNQFLSWSGFRPPARLSFGVFMFHPFVIEKQMFSIQQPITFSFKDYWFLVCGDVMISFALSALMYLTVEAPCCRIISHLFKAKKKEDPDGAKEMFDFQISRNTE